jgi:WD40 repeat protein
LKFFDRDAVFSGEVKLDAPVISLCASKDTREMLAATSIGTIFRVNAANRQFITISEAHTQAVVAVAFSIDQNDKFATASLDATIRVWDIADYAVIATGHARRDQERGVVPACLAFSDILISGWSDGRYAVSLIIFYLINEHPECWRTHQLRAKVCGSLTTLMQEEFPPLH